jgi:Cu(I)/Ag(I) efflux system membrane fusion protein
MSAEIASDACPGRTFPGRVVAIAPALDPATNSALVRVAVENPERLLKVGMFAEVRVALSRKPGALSVPPAALVRGEGGAAVYAVEGETATRTPVKVGLETAEAVELLSGVKEGQTVLVSSVHGLGAKARLAAKP